MSSPNPSDDERLRRHWQSVGRFVLNALIAYGVAACGHQPVFPVLDESDLDGSTVDEETRVDWTPEEPDWTRFEAEFQQDQPRKDANRREGKL